MHLLLVVVLLSAGAAAVRAEDAITPAALGPRATGARPDAQPDGAPGEVTGCVMVRDVNGAHRASPHEHLRHVQVPVASPHDPDAHTLAALPRSAVNKSKPYRENGAHNGNQKEKPTIPQPHDPPEGPSPPGPKRPEPDGQPGTQTTPRPCGPHQQRSPLRRHLRQTRPRHERRP